MTTLLSELLEANRGRGVRGVWRIEGSSERVERLKAQVLEAICRETQPFVHYEDPPVGLPGTVGATGCALGVWRLPLGASGGHLLSWLYLGNWQLYVRAQPLPSVPDLCRASDAEVQEFLAQSGTSVVIDSFHDDILWVVGTHQ
jgi:hypothetical protein